MQPSLGYLSVRQHAEHGFFGGYLIVNQLARPLEFHCSLPVQPSRAQQLLYGATLEEFVSGEQIGKALTERARSTPQLLLTDCAPVLALSAVSDVPVVHWFSGDPAATSESLRIPSRFLGEIRSMDWNGQRIDLPHAAGVEADRVTQLLECMSPTLDLGEPFRRVHEALLEAHPFARAA